MTFTDVIGLSLLAVCAFLLWLAVMGLIDEWRDR